MKDLKLTLIKTKEFNLTPYGKFVFITSSRETETPNKIGFFEVKVYHETTYPLDKKQEKEVVKMMKTHKTDVLTDGKKYYTRTQYGLTEINHRKLEQYKCDYDFKQKVDNGYSF